MSDAVHAKIIIEIEGDFFNGAEQNLGQNCTSSVRHLVGDAFGKNIVENATVRLSFIKEDRAL